MLTVLSKNDLLYLKLYKQVITNINCKDSNCYVPKEQNSKINECTNL